MLSPLQPTLQRRQHYFCVSGGGALLLTSIFNQAGFDIVPFLVFVEHNMAHVPPIYAFQLFVVVVVGTTLVPPI
jgi:hypothetical protein